MVKIKDIILKFKMILTNFSRILMSFLFINVGSFLGNKVHASMEPTCYMTSPSEDAKNVNDIINVSNFDIGNVFFIFVPIVIIGVVAIIVIIKYKNKRKDKQHKDKKEKNI